MTEQHGRTPDGPPRAGRKILLNGLSALMLVVAALLAWAVVFRSPEPQQPASPIAPPARSAGADAKSSAAGDAAGKKAPRIIQLDVQNGCGVKGAASRFTTYLRANGFDVVEMKNYKSSRIPKTLVIDRVGDLTAARRVAQALGVADNNVIQQLNADYFVDVSVVVGGDYQQLRPMH